jgi:hypothetical protein
MRTLLTPFSRIAGQTHVATGRGSLEGHLRVRRRGRAVLAAFIWAIW